MKKVCIIGGGAAGMMAAYSASLSGRVEVALLEKNERLGRKLLITGKGRCNVTNTGDLDNFMENIPHGGSFLYSAFSSFNNNDLITLLNENGLKTKVERGGRVFPESDKAADVAGAFMHMLKARGIAVKYGAAVSDVSYYDGVFVLTLKNGEKLRADAVIIATGGLSYPITGSDGDGYRIAKSLGHNITELYPSLVGLKVAEKYPKLLEGLSLKNVTITLADSNGKAVYKDFGEMLFTHNGVSGPIILSASARAAERLSREKFTLYINLKPALDEKMLDLRLLRDFNKNKNKDVLNALGDLLPKSMIPVIVEAAGIIPYKKVNEITKDERKALIRALTSFPLTVTGSEGFESAVVTRGGVRLAEVNPKTMESKKIKGLYFAGEILDTDAYTGGYNLQIAFSTGFLAGKSAAL